MLLALLFKWIKTILLVLYIQQTKIIERSIDSNRFCFVELSRQLGNLTSSEYHSLKGLWKISKASTKPLDLIVYLRTDPEVAHARMTQRKRSEENTVSLDYLKVGCAGFILLRN